MFTFLILFRFAAIASASERETISHFSTGDYSIKSGPAKDCGEGEFKVSDDGQNILLGARHGVFAHTVADQTINGDAEGDEDCQYKYSSTIVSNKDHDQVTLLDIRTCAGKLSYKMTQVVQIKETSISLSYDREGDEKSNYVCSWAKASQSGPIRKKR